MNFPQLRRELLEMEAHDQEEIRAFAQAMRNSDDPVAQGHLKNALKTSIRKRTQRMMDILAIIEYPTVKNIGIDGSQAVLVITLHSSLNIMKKILGIFEDCFQHDKSNIYYQGIPPLKDRILILEHKKQLFGTQWMQDKKGNPFLFPVEDFSNVNKLRDSYGLRPLRKPIDLSVSSEQRPAITVAQENDQKEPTSEEYKEYADPYLRV